MYILLYKYNIFIHVYIIILLYYCMYKYIIYYTFSVLDCNYTLPSLINIDYNNKQHNNE